MTHRSMLRFVVLAGVLAAHAPGCGSRPAGSDPAARAVPETRIVMDGRMDDWPEDVAALADRDYLYLRVALGEDDPPALQAMGDQTLVLLLDIDADPTTGHRFREPRVASTLGAELRIEFSPFDAGAGRTGGGTAVYVLDGAGSRAPIGHADIGLMAAPTYAAPWYEIRISRDLGRIPGLPERGLLSSGRVAGLFKMLGPDGRFDGRRSDPFWADLPPARGGPKLADARIPPRAEGSVRVVSYNVDRTAPASDPVPFARMLKALDPDIVLFQEWVEGTALDIEAWLNEHVPAEGSQWYAVKGAGWGVAVAARHPLEPLGPGEMYVEGSERPVRFVAAGVLTPEGPAAVASVHLTCCGGADGPEDRLRMAEADAINSAMRVALTGREPALSLIGGDVNPVGTRSPLEVLAAGLGPGGADLQPAPAMVLGDRAKYTWFRAESAFSPGGLDWMLAGAEVVNAFAVDTARLTDAALSRAGLRREDSRASDHLPVVVDVRPGG